MHLTNRGGITVTADNRVVILLREDTKLAQVKAMIRDQVIDEGFHVRAELGIFEIELDTPNFAVTEAIRELLEPFRPPMIVEKTHNEKKELVPKPKGYNPLEGVCIDCDDYRLPGISREFLEGIKLHCGAYDVRIKALGFGCFEIKGPTEQVHCLVHEAFFYINPLATL